MKLIDTLLDLLYPPRCPFCHRFLDGGMRVCSRCERSLPYMPAGRVDRSFKNVDECFSVLRYEGDVRKSLHRYKFGGISAYAGCYAKLLAECIEDNAIYADVVTWTPLSARRLRERGYDQARLLAEGAAEYMETPCLSLLKKRRHNAAQSGTKSADERRKNVRGVYAYAGNTPLDGRTVLLVDDIVTTGATLDECAGVLRKAGAAEILALTLACTMD